MVNALIEINHLKFGANEFNDRFGRGMQKRIRQEPLWRVVRRGNHSNSVGAPPGQRAMKVDRIGDIMNMELVEEHHTSPPCQSSHRRLHVAPMAR